MESGSPCETDPCISEARHPARIPRLGARSLGAFFAMSRPGADIATSGLLLDPDEARRRLESRLGPLRTRLRLGIEREHEAQAFGQGLSFLHLENLPLMQTMIEIALRVTGTYWRGRANACKVQVRRNIVRLPNACLQPSCRLPEGGRYKGVDDKGESEP